MVVKKNIGARSLTRTKMFLLTDQLRVLRLERSKKLLRVLKEKMPILLFSDEKYLTAETDRFIAKKNAKEVPEAVRSAQKSKHSEQVKVFGLIASSGEKMLPIFLKIGLWMGAKQYLDQF